MPLSPILGPLQLEQRLAHRRARDAWVDAALKNAPLASSRARPQGNGWPSASPQHPTYNGAYQRVLDAHTQSRLTAGNRVKLLKNKASGVEKMALMQRAQKTLYVSALLFHCDDGGKRFAHGLIDAAKRGVDVRLVLDGIGTWAGVGCFQMLRAGGVDLAISTRSITPTSIDWETHDKLFIVDGQVAIVGGQNIGSWYFDSNGKDSNYRDTDARIEGPVVQHIARRFAAIWHQLRPSDASMDRYLLAIRDQEARDAKAGLVGQDAYDGWFGPEGPKGLCRFVSQDPQRGTFHVFSAYSSLAEASGQHVRMHALSLEPTGSPKQDRLRDALVRLAQKPEGRVDIITNGPGLSATSSLPPELGRMFGTTFLKNTYDGFSGSPVDVWGHHVYLHSKVFDFDGAWVGIGSFNYDASGLRCQESTLICADPALRSEVDTMWTEDFAMATPLPWGEPVKSATAQTAP